MGNKHNIVCGKTFSEMETEIFEKEKKLAEFKDSLQRLQAEFENFSKRIEKEKQHFMEFSNAETLKEFLPLLDSFDSALKKLQETKSDSVSKKDALDGIELLHKQFQSVLKKAGVEEMNCIGQKFNPELQDCVLSEKDPKKEDGIVLEELQKGLMLKGKVLRHAKVKVNKKE